MFINKNEWEHDVMCAIKISIIEQLKREGLIDEKEFNTLKKQIK